MFEIFELVKFVYFSVVHTSKLLHANRMNGSFGVESRVCKPNRIARKNNQICHRNDEILIFCFEEKNVNNPETS